MSKPNVKCAVCGGSNFIADAGFFFCSECNTQSQDIREEVYDDYFGTQKVTTRVLQKKSATKSSGQNEKLTSWEVLNYVLKGITEELIELGAQPFLKIVVLQLWASYLRKLEIAFTSVEIERKPKLGYAFKRSDATIIYGISEKDLKEKSWRTRSRGSSAASSTSNTSDSELNTSATSVSQSRRSILRKLTMRKKALASAEYNKISQETTKSISQSQTLEELDSEDNEAPKRIKVTKHTKSLLNSSGASSTEDESKSVQRRLSKREVSSLRNVTMAKLVAIINVAMALNKEDIHLSDFLRWVDEGHISLRSARKFLPEETKIDSQIQRMLEVGHLSYNKCRQLMVALCNELDIIELPSPNIDSLVDRYCVELQLPNVLSVMVKKLMRLSINNKSCRSKIHESRHPEVQVMSAIVVVMKLLFSLDDCTEYRLSHVAAEYNRASRVNGENEEMFVFSEWMEYIECRKAVVASCHLPTRTSVYGHTLGRDSHQFLQHFAHTVGSIGYRESIQKYALNKRWVEALTRCLEKLGASEPESEGIRFPGSLTPLYSYTQALLSQYGEQVAAVQDRLSQHFTSLSIDYITNPNRFIDVGVVNGLNIVEKKGVAATFQIKNLAPREKDGIVLPRHGINKYDVKVHVVKRLKTKKKKTVTLPSETDLNNSSFLSEIIADDSDEEEMDIDAPVQNQSEVMEQNTSLFTSVDLFQPCSQYWFCHTKLGKNNTTYDEFDVFSKKTFPSSFLWLLKECARMIYVPTKDLYANIVSIESKHQNILNEAIYIKSKSREKNI